MPNAKRKYGHMCDNCHREWVGEVCATRNLCSSFVIMCPICRGVPYTRDKIWWYIEDEFTEWARLVRLKKKEESVNE